MWQDGTPTDIKPFIDMDGVKFNFLDTAAGEKSFEILRATTVRRCRLNTSC